MAPRRPSASTRRGRRGPASILYVPSPQHRDRVLGDGLCGARVPIIGGDGEGYWADVGPGCKVDALVLAHQGVVVPEGLDRLTRALAQHELGDAVTTRNRWLMPWLEPRTCRWVLTLGYESWSYVGAEGYSSEIVVPGLQQPPFEDDHGLGMALALATIAAARMGGKVVELPVRMGGAA